MENNVSRDKRGLIKGAIGTVRDVAEIGGYIKDFIFNLAGPIFRNLKADDNKAAIVSMTRRLLPQTGLRGHTVGRNVRTLMANGEVQNTMDTMQRNWIRYNVQSLWANDQNEQEGSTTFLHGKNL